MLSVKSSDLLRCLTFPFFERKVPVSSLNIPLPLRMDPKIDRGISGELCSSRDVPSEDNKRAVVGISCCEIFDAALSGMLSISNRKKRMRIINLFLRAMFEATRDEDDRANSQVELIIPEIRRLVRDESSRIVSLLEPSLTEMLEMSNEIRPTDEQCDASGAFIKNLEEMKERTLKEIRDEVKARVRGSSLVSHL